MDFSENYSCKYQKEIQSVHFGASQKQISLHTGVAYTKVATIPFATVSDNLKHGLPAIWAHLAVILNYLKETTAVDIVLLSVMDLQHNTDQEATYTYLL